MKKLFILLLSIALFSCKKDVEIQNDTIIIKVNSTTPVNGRVMGINDDIQIRYTLFPIVDVVDSTVQNDVRPCKTYEIYLESTAYFTVDIVVSGDNGIKTYQFKSKGERIAKEFTR